ncbi:MAG: hypothetical protein EOP11_16450 [Proteobacteria bacterium]|nr:MAG: hypothetical protein EOP11_16450 [Pseudomonadota bacterium]
MSLKNMAATASNKAPLPESSAYTRLAEIREISLSLGKVFAASEIEAGRELSRRDHSSYFASLPDAQQIALLNALREYHAICAEVTPEAARRGHKHAIQRHLARHKVRMDQGVMDILDRHECVELYDYNFVQTYRSPNFLKYIDHSLEDLAVLPYYEMFTRSEEVSKAVMVNSIRVLMGEHVGPMWNFLGRHIVKEKGSARVSRVNSIVCAPLYSKYSEEILGLVHVFDIENHTEITLMH